MFQAVCCSDGASCCPNGYTCDVAHQMCNPKDGGLKSLSTSAIVEIVGNVPCDSQSACQDGQTCCKLASGKWGCCPYPQVRPPSGCFPYLQVCVSKLFEISSCIVWL